MKLSFGGRGIFVDVVCAVERGQILHGVLSAEVTIIWIVCTVFATDWVSVKNDSITNMYHFCQHFTNALFRAVVNKKQCETRGLFISLVIHYWIGDVQDSQDDPSPKLHCVRWGIKLYFGILITFVYKHFIHMHIIFGVLLSICAVEFLQFCSYPTYPMCFCTV